MHSLQKHTVDIFHVTLRSTAEKMYAFIHFR